MKVKSVTFNWRQVGSTIDRDRVGEDYNKSTVGLHGVLLIEENEPQNGNQVWNYVVTCEDGTKTRIFNPNFVEYFKD